ncbi:MAG: class I SAM-dependent methyltransferase [Deltaproteobacteria bacterium]|nr:class I SAM-dependent methyltransferase [Deltaproteobacteria bacterium]
MPFTLDDVVPWGRSFEEYCEMFDLREADLERRILGCADGPASFNRGVHERGGRVVSVDPIYEWNPVELHEQIDATYDTIMAEAQRNRDQFKWTTIRSVEEMGALRLAAMHDFLEDLVPGKEQGRYVPGRLPDLPFPDGTFDLALCAHFLFLYSERLGLDFHVASLVELCRVAREVRVFPLLNLDGERSRHVDEATRALRERGVDVEIRTVDYEFRIGGNELMTLLPRS